MSATTPVGLEAVMHCEIDGVSALLAAAWDATRYTEAGVTVWPGGRFAAVALRFLAYEGCTDDIDPDGERADHLVEALGDLGIPFEHHLEDLAAWTAEA